MKFVCVAMYVCVLSDESLLTDLLMTSFNTVLINTGLPYGVPGLLDGKTSTFFCVFISTILKILYVQYFYPAEVIHQIQRILLCVISIFLAITKKFV